MSYLRILARAIRALWRWFSGARMNGEAYTAPRVSRPKRAAWRTLATLGAVALAWGYLFHPEATRAVLWGLGIAAAPLAVWGAYRAVLAVRRWWAERAHRKRVVRPLCSVLAPVLGMPERELFRRIRVSVQTRMRKAPGVEAGEEDNDTGQGSASLTVPVPDNFPPSHAREVEAVLRQRLRGRWAFTWHMDASPFTLTGRRVPTPPRKVDYADPTVRAAIEQCANGEVMLGLDPARKPFAVRLTGETAHWGLSVGSGGGKSAFLMYVITQLVRQGATVVVPDVKRASISPLDGVPGIHIYNDPDNGVKDMRDAVAWVRAECEARTYLKNRDPKITFPRLVLILEEGNEFGDLNKEFWAELNEGKKKAPDPVWRDIASIMRMGRFVDCNVIGVFQDLRDSAVGGRGLRNLFTLFILGQYKARQWAMLVGTAPVPSQKGAGRMVVVEGDAHTWIQVPYTDPENFRAECLDLRTAQGYTEDHLYGTPPARSPERMPELLAGGSVTPSRHAEGGPVPGGDAGASPDVPTQSGVMRDGTRHGLHLVKGGAEGGPLAVEAGEVEEAPEERFTFAELERRGNIGGLTADALRAAKYRAKKRGTPFPEGVEIDGETRYTEAEIIAWNTARKAN